MRLPCLGSAFDLDHCEQLTGSTMLVTAVNPLQAKGQCGAGVSAAMRSAGIADLSSRIFQAEHPMHVIVGEAFSVSPPADDGTQCVLGVLGAQMVLQFGKEAVAGRHMAGSLIEYPTDMRR